MPPRARNTPALPISHPEVGTVFAERYHLTAVLGMGGGSVVFRALDQRLNRPVALKILALHMDEAGIGRFRREALSIARLSHPSIVTLYEFDEYEGQPYLVLELLKGRDLWEVMYETQQALSLEATLTITLNILDALAYAHQAGVVHRDLKPENVMVLDSAYNIKVMDFGLAYIRGQSRITQDHSIAGSAFYLAPEVANGEVGDQRVDLYALGVMLYEMTTGRLPFYSDNSLAVIAQQLHEVPPLPTELNPALTSTLEEVILKLMAKKPADRFASAQEVKRALLALEGAEGVAFQPASPEALLQRIERATLIGREGEWARMRAAWQQVQLATLNARPVLMLGGAAGSGKSQLVHQLLLEARHTGAKTFIGQCYLGDTLPYRPISEILRDALWDARIELSPAAATDLARLVPELAARYPVEAQAGAGGEVEQLRLFEQVTRLFSGLAQQQPLILLLEDLHAADPSTISLLAYMGRHLRGSACLLVGTYRPADIDHRHALDGLLRDFAAHELMERVTLRRLESDEVERWLAFIFGHKPSAAFSRLIEEKAEGNLFFIKELLKSLVMEGHIYYDPQRQAWEHRRLEDLELPGSIRSIISQQLARLSPEALNLLTIAAVIGREFPFELLALVTELEEDALLAGLEEAQEARLIREKRSGREEVYLFENTSIRQSLLGELRQRQKARLHLQIARALEQHFPQPSGALVETIARHYSLGARTDAELEQAVHYLVKAADRASDLFALPNAYDLYTQAIDLLQELNEQQARLLLLRERRGLVGQQMGAFKTAAQDLRSVLNAAEIRSDPLRQRRVLLHLGQVYRRDEQFGEAIRFLQQAVAISRTMPDERLVADALFFLGATYWSEREIAQAVQHQQEAYEIVQRLGLQDKIAMRVLHGLGECYLFLGRLEECRHLIQESLQLARHFEDMEYQAENLDVLGRAEIELGEYQHALAILEDSLATCRRARLRLHEFYALSAYGSAQGLMGNYQQALQSLEQALEIANEDAKGISLTFSWLQIGRCHYELAMIEQAAADFANARDHAERNRSSWSAAALFAHWGLAQIQLGNLEFAGLLEETLLDSQQRGELLYLPDLHYTLGMLALARGNPSTALSWANKMRAAASKMQQKAALAQAYSLEGEALTALGQVAEAQLALQAGLELVTTFKRPHLTWTLHAALVALYHKVGDTEKLQHHRQRVRAVLNEILRQIDEAALRERLEGLM